MNSETIKSSEKNSGTTIEQEKTRDNVEEINNFAWIKKAKDFVVDSWVDPETGKSFSDFFNEEFELKQMLNEETSLQKIANRWETTSITVGLFIAKELLVGFLKIIKSKGKEGFLGGFKQGLGIFFSQRDKK
jgi:hypothetical protein